VSSPPTTSAGLSGLRSAPVGLPDAVHRPPTIAESNDPFSASRVIDLVARLERGRPVRIADLVDRLNASHLDWLFSQAVVLDALLQLQVNWMADYRNSGGVVIEDGLLGATVAIEDSSRVDPWIVRQAERIDAECRALLAEFSRRDHGTGDG